MNVSVVLFLSEMVSQRLPTFYKRREISLHRTGFPAILIRCADGDVGDKQQTSIQDVEHDKYAQLMPVWIEASKYSYREVYKKYYDDSS